jgi:hypothetical protein
MSYREVSVMEVKEILRLGDCPMNGSGSFSVVTVGGR